MGRCKEYTLAGRTFPTQTSLEAAVRERLKLHARQPGKLVQDDFLASVINAQHAGVRETGQWSNGWFVFVGWHDAQRRGWWKLVGVQTHPDGVLVAQFAPSGLWCDVSARPWRDSRGRYSDVALVLTGKPAAVPSRGPTLEWEETR